MDVAKKRHLTSYIKDIMLEGLEILIKRMDTNPDEFINGHWDYFFEDNPINADIYTEEEMQAIADAKVKLTEFRKQSYRQRLTEQVITRIFETDNRSLRSDTTSNILRHGIEKMQMEIDWGRK